jgi:hypothetical protein
MITLLYRTVSKLIAMAEGRDLVRFDAPHGEGMMLVVC